MSSRPRGSARAAILVLLALAAVACSSQVNDPASGETPPPSETETPSEDAGPKPSDPAPIAVDLAPGGAATVLDNGWSIQHCEGDAPLLCVTDGDGTIVGTVELGSYPANDEIAEAVATGTVLAALEARVAEQHEWVTADRAKGCGPEYEYRGEPSTTTTIGGQPAAVFAFSGLVDGREIERHRAYYTVHAGQLWVVNAAASDPEGCMATDLPEFAPADLVTFEPYMERIVAGLQLPAAGTAITMGMVVGVDGGLDGGLLYLLWGGGKQRIQQPSPLTEQDITNLGLVRGPAIAELAVTDVPGSAYFAVIPADGPDARLHLVADGIVREVLVQHIAAGPIEAMPDLHNLAIDRVRPARSAAG